MGTLSETREQLQDPAVAASAAKWAKKYREDRSKPAAARVQIIADKLQSEFKLDRKVARQMAKYATRDWA